MSPDTITTAELARYLGIPAEAIQLEMGRLTIQLSHSDAAVIVATPLRTGVDAARLAPCARTRD